METTEEKIAVLEWAIDYLARRQQFIEHKRDDDGFVLPLIEMVMNKAREAVKIKKEAQDAEQITQVNQCSKSDNRG